MRVKWTLQEEVIGWRDPSWKGLLFYQLAVRRYSHMLTLSPSPGSRRRLLAHCPQDTDQEGHGSPQPSWACSLPLPELVPYSSSQPPAAPGRPCVCCLPLGGLKALHISAGNSPASSASSVPSDRLCLPPLERPGLSLGDQRYLVGSIWPISPALEDILDRRWLTHSSSGAFTVCQLLGQELGRK